MNSETFLYLGKCLGTHFFIQKQNNENYVDICSQIYNVMIHETMIMENDVVIIYSFMENGSLEVVCIQHQLFTIKTFYTDDLANMFTRLTNTDRGSNIMTIRYDGQYYEMYESANLNDWNVNSNVVVDKIHYIITIKPIGYL